VNRKDYLKLESGLVRWQPIALKECRRIMSSCTPLKEKMSMIRSIYQYANIVPRPEVTWSASATLLKTTDHYCGIKRSYYLSD